MTPAELNLRIRQLHASLHAMATEDLSTVKPRVGETADRFYVSVDFSDGMSDAALWNAVDLLLGNIGRLRDHLIEWCDMQGRPLDKQQKKQVLLADRSAAVIQDLWNGQKHPGQEAAPWSGSWPRLSEMRRSMVLSTGRGPSSTVMTLDRNGRPVIMTTGGGKAELVIDGDILDGSGVRIGGFIETCEQAVAAWESAFVAAGVPVPPRT